MTIRSAVHCLNHSAITLYSCSITDCDNKRYSVSNSVNKSCSITDCEDKRYSISNSDNKIHSSATNNNKTYPNH